MSDYIESKLKDKQRPGQHSNRENSTKQGEAKTSYERHGEVRESRQQVDNRHDAFGMRDSSRKQGDAQSTKVEAKERKYPGESDIPDARALSRAGEHPFRDNLTDAGHAFQKHGDRHPERWQRPQGN